VGERTRGILVGPATGHQLIDGGSITVPGARLYDNAGHWFWEGEGVSPDIAVWDEPNILIKGRDPQMEKVVEEVSKLTKENKHVMSSPNCFITYFLKKRGKIENSKKHFFRFTV